MNDEIKLIRYDVILGTFVLQKLVKSRRVMNGAGQSASLVVLERIYTEGMELSGR